MALSIPSPQSVYRGNYASLPAATLKPPVEGNRTIPVNIGWAASGLSPNYCVEFNARHQQTLAINQIAAIHVDNSKCSSSMHIAFLDTQFEILIGPNAVGFYPVVTNSLEFFAWIDLQPSPQDTTILQVLNFLPPPILFGTQLGGTGVGTVREVDTAAPITGGPITDQGTIGLSTPLAVNFGGTGATTGNAAFDNLSGASGATTGSLQRSGTGVWSVTPGAGAGTITGVTPGNGLQGGGTTGTVSLALNAPVSVANGGTAATTPNAALDSLSQQSGSAAGVLQRSSGGGWATLLPLPVNIGSGGTGASSATAALTNLGAAPLASPVFTGAPQVPTATPATTSTNQAASTAFVQNAIGTLPVAAIAQNTGRNLADNALFNVQQRGAGPFTVNQAYTADRWQMIFNLDTQSLSVIALSDTQRAQIGDESAVYGLQNTFTGNAGAAAFNAVLQKMEKVRRLAGKTVTFSFWAAASAPLQLGVIAIQSFGTGGSPSAAVVQPGQLVTLSTTFSRYQLTFNMPSAAGKTLGTNGDDLSSIQFGFSSGSTNSGQYGGLPVQSGTVTLWGVQVEIGTAATALEKLAPETELAHCQRFYQGQTQPQAFSRQGYGAAGVVDLVVLGLPVVMRALPTLTILSPSSSNISSGPSLAAYSANSIGLYSTVAAAGQFTMSVGYTASADL